MVKKPMCIEEILMSFFHGLAFLMVLGCIPSYE